MESENDIMKIEKKSLMLYAITDDRWLKDQSLQIQVQKLILGGITCLQYREKKRNGLEKKKMAMELKALCDQAEIPFIINDDVELAKEINASGVHLGQKDCDVKVAREILGEDAIIGVSARTIQQAQKAQDEGADYLGSGAVFGTSTKDDASFLGIEKLSQICNHVSIPVVAIGGVSLENIKELKETNVSGAAVVSGLFHTDEPKEAAQKYIEQLKLSIGDH